MQTQDWGGPACWEPLESRASQACRWEPLLSRNSVGRAFNALTKAEIWARRVTGIVFLAVGIYYALKFDFGVL